MVADRGACPHIEAVEDVKQPGRAGVQRVRGNRIAVGASTNLSKLRRPAVLRLLAQRHASKHPRSSGHPVAASPKRANAGCTAITTMPSPNTDPSGQWPLPAVA